MNNSAIKRNCRVYRKWVDIGRNPHDRDHVKKVQNYTNNFIKDVKLSYYFNFGNKLPDPGFYPKTNASLSHIYATHENIVKIINNFSSKKAHGCDGIAVSMLQLCATEVAYPLRIIFKLRYNGITCSLLDFFQNSLSNRYQRVFLNSQESKWMPLKAGVPQGSVLGPLLFLIYINDLTANISSDMRLFADDSSLFACVT